MPATALSFPGSYPTGCKARPLGGLLLFWAVVLQKVDDAANAENPATLQTTS
jgi:hypothetical protein